MAGELRLDAERAITLLAEAREAAKLEGRSLENEEALDAMELGARRIDFIGYKFQAAAECATLYSRAQAIAGDKTRWDEVSEMLENIGSNNGRFEDMRDGYALLGQLFEQAWLRDNRPYWLANNTARYDRAAQMWVGRAATVAACDRSLGYDAHVGPGGGSWIAGSSGEIDSTSDSEVRGLRSEQRKSA